jgi:hypothetical protein
MALPGKTICPMCGTRVAPGASRCLSCGEKLRLSEADIDDLKRRLKGWVIRRTVICAAFVFAPAFVATQPSFGMGGPNFLSATLIAVAVAAMVGVFLAARAYLQLQRIRAENSGSTLPYEVGRKLRAILKKR